MKNKLKLLARMFRLHRCWFVAATLVYLFIIYVYVWSQ